MLYCNLGMELLIGEVLALAGWCREGDALLL